MIGLNNYHFIREGKFNNKIFGRYCAISLTNQWGFLHTLGADPGGYLYHKEGEDVDEVQTEVLQRLTRVETMVDSMNEKLDRAISANETAAKALESSKSAHHRIDKIEDNQKWLWRTFAGAIILAIAGFIISGGLN